MTETTIKIFYVISFAVVMFFIGFVSGLWTLNQRTVITQRALLAQAEKSHCPDEVIFSEEVK